MTKKRVQIGLKLDPDLIDRLDTHLASLEYPPTRTMFIELIIKRELEKAEKTRRKP